MAKPIRILLQTTILTTEDDWSIFGIKKEPRALENIKTYARNVAFWLAN
ncbi:MAG: hypothetical protein V7K18_27135 [Nostoc sp.]